MSDDSWILRGIQNQNSEPAPTCDSTPISPRICLTRESDIERPNPVPPNRRVLELSAWEKGCQRFLLSESDKPIPVSLMLHRTATSPGAQEIDGSTEQIVWTEPDAVNLRALPRRFMSTVESGETRRTRTRPVFVYLVECENNHPLPMLEHLL